MNNQFIENTSKWQNKEKDREIQKKYRNTI